MKKERRIKGFTLLELIIVLALFSLIMFSVVQLLDPVSKFFVRSSNFEDTTACVDNMKRAIEGNLKYADRIRGYRGYQPYTDISTFSPSTDLTNQVIDFYDLFFDDRQFLDCAGTIYVLCFDNTVRQSDADILGMDQLSDYTSSKSNAGMMLMYTYTFDNCPGGVIQPDSAFLPADIAYSCVPPTDWYVNQKLYGNYDYNFSLDTSIVADDPTIFNPSDFVITISMTEIRRNGSGGLIRVPVAETNAASFSMKNVLDVNSSYAEPAFDFKLTLDSTAADPLDSYNQGALIPRYAPMDVLSGSSYDGFYFIFTLPETTESRVVSGNYVEATTPTT